jgi:hypothetical protein
VQNVVGFPRFRQTFTLKMVVAIFVETLQKLEHSTPRIPESLSHTQIKDV